MTLIQLGDDDFLLLSRPSIVPKLVAEMEALRIEAGLTLDDMLTGLNEERRRLFEERYQHNQEPKL